MKHETLVGLVLACLNQYDLSALKALLDLRSAGVAAWDNDSLDILVGHSRLSPHWDKPRPGAVCGVEWREIVSTQDSTQDEAES